MNAWLFSVNLNLAYFAVLLLDYVMISMTRAWDKEKIWVPDRNPLSHFVTEHKIHRFYLLVATHDDFDTADRSSMQDACHIWTQLNVLALHEFSMLCG